MRFPIIVEPTIVPTPEVEFYMSVVHIEWGGGQTVWNKRYTNQELVELKSLFEQSCRAGSHHTPDSIYYTPKDKAQQNVFLFQ